LYGQIETIFVKLPPKKEMALHLEHFDDLLLNEGDQSSWAGLDSLLIDEEFLYLEDDEADKVYEQLK
jgi:hypothetical protein